VRIHFLGQGACLLSRAGIVKRILCRYVTVSAVTVALCLSILPSRAKEGASKRPFTVKDSIEISYIVNPTRSTAISIGGEQPLNVPIYSPNGKYFLLVTQRGELSNNTLQGTIWLFDREAVWNYALNRSASKPVPRRLVTMSAVSNTPVIYDVRWIDGSGKVAFLGKNMSPYQRLFLVDSKTASVRAVTNAESYVTAYDIQGDTIAYTVLIETRRPAGFDTDIVDVGQNNILQLMYRNQPAMEDIEDFSLLRYPSLLRVQRAGKEVPIDFKSEGRPLRLFVPTLSLSPDAKCLITVAPVYEIPREWEGYHTLFEDRGLKAGPSKNLSDPLSFWRPEQFIAVNLETGSVSPLLDAPVGRDLGYADTPTEAFWLENSRHVILTNTYLPLVATLDAHTTSSRSDHPAITVLDLSTGKVEANMDLSKSPATSEAYYEVNDIAWDTKRSEITLDYEGDAAPGPEKYALRSGEWIKSQKTDKQGSEFDGGVQLSIRQDLNHPAAVWTQINGSEAGTVLWDPNPQLQDTSLGTASIYRWQDAKGKSRSGILVLPPEYDAKQRYPLVIQTHGYQAERFFADGWATTGSGGRALVAKHIVLLQMDMAGAHFASPDEAPDELDAFEAAINHLVSDGVADRSRVGVIGFSRTCFHVRYALIHRPNLFRAASITDGFDPSYVVYTLSNGGFYSAVPQMEAINGGAPFGENLEKWVHNATGFNLDKVRTPLLISAFLPEELLGQWETYSGLRKLGKPVDMLWWWKGNTPHLLVQPAQRYASQQSAVDWFSFWLKGEEDSDPTKAEQYSRWRELRKLQERNQGDAAIN
jgi:dipeptidyl aminopeptidase/acylaminoacyl peptidase